MILETGIYRSYPEFEFLDLSFGSFTVGVGFMVELSLIFGFDVDFTCFFGLVVALPFEFD